MIRFEELEQLGVQVALITDKSDGDCRSAPPGAISDSRMRACLACGIDPESLVCARQVHGIAVSSATEADRGRGSMPGRETFRDTDGLITDVAGLPLVISVADCAPVYLVDPVRKAIGLVHAGREGTFHGISSQAVAVMRKAYGCEPSSLHALIGPSAGPEQYEVSPDIAEAWRRAGLPATGRLLDIWEANALQLEACGLAASHIHQPRICTISDMRFHSHRRDANGARNMALLML